MRQAGLGLVGSSSLRGPRAASLRLMRVVAMVAIHKTGLITLLIMGSRLYKASWGD